MNKVYFFAPLLALLAFTAVYVSHRGGARDRDAAKLAAHEAATRAKIEAEQVARRAAMSEAIAAAERRKEERAAKEARDLAQREARQAAVDAREKAFRDHERISRQIDRIRKEIGDQEAELAKLAEARAAAVAEKRFLEQFSERAEANLAALQSLFNPGGSPASPTSAGGR
jgi:hypothetical protein